MKIEIIKVNEYGMPKEGYCPEHGKVEIISMPQEGASLKSVARAEAQGRTRNDPGLAFGELSCGCKFLHFTGLSEAENKMNNVIRAIELANDIAFDNRHEIVSSEDELDFKNRMFNILNDYLYDGIYGKELKINDYDQVTDLIIEEFEGIESIKKNQNLIEELYPEKMDNNIPSNPEYTWDEFFTIRNDGSMEVATYLYNWCNNNNIDLIIDGDETPEAMIQKCVSSMYEGCEE